MRKYSDTLMLSTRHRLNRHCAGSTIEQPAYIVSRGIRQLSIITQYILLFNTQGIRWYPISVSKIAQHEHTMPKWKSEANSLLRILTKIYIYIESTRNKSKYMSHHGVCDNNIYTYSLSKLGMMHCPDHLHNRQINFEFYHCSFA